MERGNVHIPAMDPLSAVRHVSRRYAKPLLWGNCFYRG